MEENKLVTMKVEESEVLDTKELGLIWFSLEALVDFKFSKGNTMKDPMKELAKIYEKTLASKKVFLLK